MKQKTLGIILLFAGAFLLVGGFTFLPASLFSEGFEWQHLSLEQLNSGVINWHKQAILPTEPLNFDWKYQLCGTYCSEVWQVGNCGGFRLDAFVDGSKVGGILYENQFTPDRIFAIPPEIAPSYTYQFGASPRILCEQAITRGIGSEHWTGIAGGIHKLEIKQASKFYNTASGRWEYNPIPQWTTVLQGNFYLEDKACADTEKYVVKVVNAKAGDTLTLTPLAGQLGFPGWVSFCRTLPIIKQKENLIIEQAVAPYDSVKNGGTFTVPAGEVWLFFYKALPSTDTLTLCGDDSIYDEANNKCILKPTFEYTCSVGQFNPDTKTCVVQANSEIICLEGVYNQATSKCEKTILETTFVCKQGTFNSSSNTCVSEIDSKTYACKEGTYDELRKSCVLDITETSFNCPTGSTFVQVNPELGKCIINPETELVCKDTSTTLVGDKCVKEAEILIGPITDDGQKPLSFKFSSLIGIGLMVLGGVLLVRKGKKR